MNVNPFAEGRGNELVRQVFEAIPSGVVVMDRAGTIVYSNRHAERMFHYAPGELLGSVIETLVPDTPRAGTAAWRSEFLSDAMAGVSRGNRQLRGRRRDGQEIPLEVGLHLIVTEQGPFVMAVLVDLRERFRDLSDRKRSEQELAAANAQLAGVLDAATQVSIISTDTRGLITVFNTGAQNLLGYTAEEIVGKRTPEIIHVRAEVEARGAELSRELGFPVQGFEVFVAYARLGRFDRREWTYVRKDGSRFTVSLVVTAVRNAAGDITGFLGVAEDITERKRLADRFRAAVEAAPAAMAMVNRLGQIVLVNRQMEEVFGYSREELIGSTIEMLLPERFRERHPTKRERFFAEATPRSFGGDGCLFGRRRDGTEFAIKMGLSPVDTPDGLAVICGVQDITDQIKTLEAMQQAKDAAESASRAKSSFLANMSHEIRTPMNGILGMAKLLSQTELRSHQRDYLATVEESAHTLLRLLNDILDFSKIEAGKLHLEVADFRLSESVAKAVQMLALRASEKGIEVACRVAPDIPDYLQGDSGRLQQVLVNLVGNAVKFTQAGEIYINVDAEELHEDTVRLRFSVSDTGIGIPAEKQTQIFRPFEQAEASTTRRFGGTGLGLAISRQLVEMMRGQIWLESEPGRGSTFQFTAEFSISPDQHRPETVALEVLQDLSVLIVDDNHSNRRILGELVRHWRMQPILAESAAAARNALEAASQSSHPIRLILLDHHMPSEDGLQFAESLQQDRLRPACPIIMISSGTIPIESDRSRTHGICRFMTKPVIASDLLNEILRQFGRYTTAGPSRSTTEVTLESGQARRLLLVEDNEINRRVAVGLLHARGHQVVSVENGQEAVACLAEQEFDAVLMDMQMPVMDGYEATIAIRKREREIGGHIPIIAMTAEALKGDRERCLGVGMDDYVAKPVVPADLYRAIERFPALCLPTAATVAPATRPVCSLPVSAQPGSRTSDPDGLETTASPVIVSRVVDWDVARARLGADSLQEFIDLVREQVPGLLADINRSLETRDARLLQRSAHTLTSSARYFGAESLAETAFQMERFAREENIAAAETQLALLRDHSGQFLRALDSAPISSPSRR